MEMCVQCMLDSYSLKLHCCISTYYFSPQECAGWRASEVYGRGTRQFSLQAALNKMAVADTLH